VGATCCATSLFLEGVGESTNQPLFYGMLCWVWFAVLSLFPLLAIEGSTSTPASFFLYQETRRVHGGHSSECFAFAILSYESCKQLFLRSLTCSYLQYEKKICSLHDHRLSDFTLHDGVIQRDYGEMETIVLTKLNHTSSLVPPLSQVSPVSAIQRYRKCLKKRQPQLEGFDHLPRLGIVISMTLEWAQTHEAGVNSLTSNFECYALVHNYSFVRLSLSL
jgi:hypothetical protein